MTAAPPTEILRGRYVVIRPLGRGTHSTVLLANDVASGQRRALKRLRTELPEDWLRHEFEIMARLEHPHIVRVHDFYAGEFFTMDFIEGRDVLGATRTATPEEIARLAAQALAALAAVHAEGLVHFDVKPDNLLVSDDRVVLVDFGLTRHTQAVRSGFARGTLPYIAPEMLRGEGVDQRVDLFALGRVLYEALAQAPLPARGDSPLPSLHGLRPAIPEALAAWVERLCAQDEEQRFGSALSALHALAALQALEPLTVHATEAAPESLVLAPRLVGRQGELNAAARAISRAISGGHPELVIVSGGEGLGKSRFLAALLGHCVREQKSAERLSRASAEVLLQARDAEARKERLATLRKQKTCVWLIDDAQRLSENTLLFLATWLASDPPQALCVVLAVSDEPLSAALHALSAEFAHQTTHITLSRLQRKDLATFAASALGQPLPPLWISALEAASSGNPLLAKQVLHEWIAERWLGNSSDGFAPAHARPPPASSLRLNERLWARLRHIDERHWSIVFLAALLGRELTPQRLTTFADLHDATLVPEVPAAIEEMAAQHLLDDRAEALAFAHPSLFRALRLFIPEDERALLHTLAASLFDESEPEARDYHLLRGQDDVVALEAAEAAGDRARSSFAWRRAMSRYSEGYSRAPVPRLARKAGQCAAQLGSATLALQWFDKAGVDPEERASTALERAEVLRQLCRYEEALLSAELGRGVAAERLIARLLRHLGNDAEAQAHYARALAAKPNAEEEMQLLLDRAHMLRERGELAEAMQLANQALGIAETRDDLAAKARIVHLIGHFFVLDGQGLLALDYLLEARRLAQLTGGKRTQGLALRDLGALRLQQGRFADADTLLLQAERLLAATGATNLVADCLLHRATLRAFRGELSEALALMREVLRVRREQRDARGRAYAQVAIADLHLSLGATATALHYAELALRHGREDKALLTLAGTLCVAAAIDRGEARSFEALLRGAPSAAHTVFVLLHWLPRDSSGQAALALSRLTERADFGHARLSSDAALAALAGSRDAAARLSAVVAQAEAIGDRGLAIRARSDAGFAWLQIGNREAARHELTRAMAMLRAWSESLARERRSAFLALPWHVQLRDRFRAVR